MTNARPAAIPAILKGAITGETVFGIVSRWHRLSGNRSSSETLETLFGSRTPSLACALPGRLGVLADQLSNWRLTATDLIEHHTLLPYTRPFTSRAQYTAAELALATDRGANSVKLTLGWVPSRITAADFLRYCPECLIEDEYQHGVGTWHRVHQLPGVFVCARHGLPLFESDHLALRLHRHELYLPDRPLTEFRKAVARPNRAILDRLRLIANLSVATYETRCRFVAWRSLYLRLLEFKELRAGNTTVRQQALHTAFLAFWQPVSSLPVYSSLLCPRQGEVVWLSRLVRKARGSCHPLKHLLLIGFLAQSWDEVVAANRAEDNPAVVARGRVRGDSAVGNELKRLIKVDGLSVSKAARVLGISSNTALTIAQQSRLPVNRRPKKLQPALRSGIRNALRKGKSLAVICKEMRVSMSTVSRILAGDLRLRDARKKARHRSARASARRTWIKAARRYSDLGWPLVRQHAKAAHMWLYRHDRVWLREVSRRHGKVLSPRSKVVDWESRDRVVAAQVAAAVDEIVRDPARPFRVTVSEIGRRIGKVSLLHKSLDRLPETRKVIALSAETTAEFQNRRIQWWKRRLMAEFGSSPAAWRVSRLAGVANDRRPTRYCN